MELDEANRRPSALGQAVLALARRLDAQQDTGPGVAALTREWRRTLEAATADARQSDSALGSARDELARRRAARGA